MKRILGSLLVCSVFLTATTSCADLFREEIYDIHTELDKINERLDELSKRLNANVSSLQSIVDALQQKDYVDKILPIMEGGVEIGYEIFFTQSGSVKIYHGEKGDDGHSPVVGMKQAEDGRWYWTIDGEWMLDENNNRVLAIAEDGENGLTPRFEVRDGDWYISYDNGESWKFYGQATGDKGDKGDSMFSSVEYNDQYVILVLADGVTTIKLPTWASHQLLVDEIARMNSNIEALQKAVAALEQNDYVTKVTPIEGEDGSIIGYVLSFAYTGDVAIYHGKDGQDGHNPVVAAKLDTDGNWYWTVDGEWLLDENQNKIRTTGDNGLTPQFKIEDGTWYIRYSDEEEWKEYGQATGDKGEQGDKGDQGDAIFAKDGIDISNPDYIELTLANGTKIQFPTLAAILALQEYVNQLNENIISLQTIVTGLQNNDYVTSISEIIDPQTNTVIGYTLHFAKSGSVDIYHGEDGKDGVTPTVTISEDGYWVINGVKQSVKALAVDGVNGITPQFKIEDGMWLVSYDNGGSWVQTGQATGDQGPQGPQGPQGSTGEVGDSFFKSITEEYATDEGGKVITDILGKPVVAYIVITLNDDDDDDSNNPVYKIPTDYVIGDLQKQIDAITNEIKTIQIVLNAVQNCEYIKSCEMLYDGLVHIGYEIVFAKYTVEGGESLRRVTIYNGTNGVNGTVIGAKYDEATQTWYWTINDEPLRDADGNLVPLQGKDGVTPQMNINATTNFWEVSYDGGKTWISTGIKATGPQGDAGAAGSNAESYIQDVKLEGDYYIFYVKDGSTFSVPTAKAFETLAKRIAALEESASSISSILSVLQEMKYVKSCERFENETGSGYKLVLVTFDPVTMTTSEEICYVYDGKNGEAGANGKTPVIGLRQDANGDYYWTLDGEDLLVNGKPVKANGADGQPGAAGAPGAAGPVPTFRIDADGYLWVKVGDAEEQNLGKVVGATGSAGAAGSDASISVDVKPSGEVVITFMKDGVATGSVSVPSWEAFLALQEQVNTLNGNIASLQTSVEALLGHDCVIAVVEDKKDGVVVGYTLTFAKSGDKYISLGQDGADGQPGAPGTPGEDGHTPVIGVASFEGVLYWTVDGEWLTDANGQKVPVTGNNGADGQPGQAGQPGADGKTPKFKIVNGDWYYSYDKDNTSDDNTEGWIYAGRATGSAGEAGAGGDSFFAGVTPIGADQVTVVASAEAYYIKIELTSGASYLIPTQKTTDAINAMVASANSNISALQTAVTALENNDYVTKVEEYKENGVSLGYKITFSKGTTAIIYHGAKGEQGDKGADGVTPTVSINEQGYWVINGEVTTIKAAGDNGQNGITPEFKIDSYTDAEGNVYTAYWYVKYGENAEWQPLGQALGPQGPQGEQGGQGPEGPQGPAGVTGDAFIYGIVALGEDGVTTEGVTFQNAYYIKIILNDETPDTLEDNVTYIIPTKKVTDHLYALVEQLNDNVESLQVAVNALSSRQYIKSYSPIEGGYKLTLSDGDDPDTEDDVIYIHHGTNGTNGTNGVTPTVTVKADTDGVLYWYVNDTWLLDANGNKVPATGAQGPQGEPGQNGQPGENGAAGTNGITPQFMIGNADVNGSTYTNCWLVSYDNGETWSPVLGADGKPFIAKGETGGTGDSFFQAVDFESVKDENGLDKVAYIVLTIDNQVYKIPTEYTIIKLEARINALEQQFSAIQTIVNAINKQEYVKKIVGVYNGLQLTGYRITFVTYSIAEDGTLQETEVERTITYTATENVPVVGAEQDETTGIWYWTIDGVRIKDKDGNDIPLQGPQGEQGPAGTPGATPEITIGNNGNWFVDGVDTGVQAQGPQGPQGPQGQPGDSFFQSVTYVDADGNEVTVASKAYYIKFTFANGDVIMVPTASAFQSLIAAVEELKGTVNGLADALDLQKTALESLAGSYNDFIAGLESKRFVGTPTYNATTQTWTFPVLNGNGEPVAGESFVIVQGNVVTVGTKEGSDRLYWVIDGVVTDYPVTGNDGANGLTPNFRVNVEEGTLEYTFDDPTSPTAKWESLGSVKGPQGDQGNPGQPGTAASTNVVFTNNPYPAEGGIVFIDSTNHEAVQSALWVGVQYGESIDQIIWMPTYANFVALSNLLETLDSNVAALQAAVAALENNDYVTSITDVTADGVVIGYTLNFAKSGPKTIYHGQKGETGDNGLDAVAPLVRINPESKEWEISTDGGQTYVSTGVVAVGPQGDTGSQGPEGVTPKFKIENGSWFVSYDNEQTWKNLGQATGDTGAAGNDGDSFFKSVTPVTADGTESTSADAEYIKIELTSDDSYLIPTQKTIVAINTTISDLQASVNDQIEAIRAVVDALPNNKYITAIVPVDSSKNEIAEGSTSTVAGYKIVFYGSDPIYIMNGADGATGPQGPQGEQGIQGNTPEITIGENGNWFINGVDTGKVAVPKDGENGAQGPQGEAGVTPKLQVGVNNEWQVSYDGGTTWEGLGIYAVPQFKIEGGKWMVSYDGGSTWTEKGQATGDTGAAGNDGDSFFKSVTPVTADGTESTSADAEYIKIELTSGETYLIPTQKTITELQERVTALETQVASIQTLVTEHSTTLTDLSGRIAAYESEKDSYMKSADFEEWKNNTEFITSASISGDKITFGVVDGNGAVKTPVEVTITHPVSVYMKEDGKYYWQIGDVQTDEPVMSDILFKVDASGKLLYSTNGADWNVLDVVDSSNPDIAKTDIVFAESINADNTWVESTNPSEANWIGIKYSDDDIVWMPTYKNFVDITARLAAVEQSVDIISGQIVDLTGSLSELSQSLTDLANGAMTKEQFEEWKTSAEFVKSVVLDGDKLVVTAVNGNGTVTSTSEMSITHPVSVYTNSENKLCWKIDGRETGILVESEPHFAIDDNGNLKYTFDDPSSSTAEWVVLDAVDPENPDMSTTSIVFTNDPYAADGWEAVDASVANWIGIKYSDTDIIWMPTYRNFVTLQTQVNTISQNVNALNSLMGGNNFVTSLTEIKNDSGVVVGFEAVLGGYTYNPSTGSYVVNSPDANTSFVYSDAVSVVMKDGKYYWHIATGDTYTDVLVDQTNLPKIEVYEGYIYVSVDPRATTVASDIASGKQNYWNKLEGLVDNDTPDTHAVVRQVTENGYLYYEITMWNENGEETVIKVPSEAAFNSLVSDVNVLKDNMSLVSDLLSDLTYVSKVEPVYDNATNGNIIGFKITYKSMTGSVAENTAEFTESSTTTYTSTNYVVPVKKDNVWYWYANGSELCPITHTFVPKIEVYDGYIYVSVDSRATTVKTDIEGENGSYWKKLEHKDDNTQIPDTDTYGSYTEVKVDNTVVGYEITFPGQSTPIQVGKYFATPKVAITDSEGNAVATLNIGSSTTGEVKFSVIGSFAANDAPEIIVTCEGGWTSSMERTDAANSVTGTITVTPTAVFNSGQVSGKLTVYVSYYGQTSMKQISLQANANVAFNSTRTIPSTGDAVTIDFSTDMIPESEVPSLGFVYEYTDTDPESDIIEAQKVLSNNSSVHGKWIKNNGTENGKINLLVDANVTSRKRAAVVVAYTPDKKIELARFRIIQDEHTPTSADPAIINLADPENNGNYDPANCYVIKTAGRYMIPTFKGNNSTNEGKIDIEGATVKIYNQKNSTIDGWFANTVTRITSLSNGTPIPNDMIVLDIKSVGDIVNTLKDGNAVVAVEKGGETLWSWHLWFNSEFEIIGNSIGSQQDQNYSDTVTMMDRNLGATSSTDSGLYYMWGNKNPYFTAVETSSQAESTTYHGGGSATREWTNTKSLTDPCPPGYKVPTTDVWVTTETASTKNSGFLYSSSPEIVYQFSGHVDLSGKLDSDAKTLPKEITDSSTTVVYTGLDLSDAGVVWDLIKENVTEILKGGLKVQAKRFNNIRYNIDMQQKKGSLWGTNSLAFQYLNQDVAFSIDIVNQIEVLECDYDIGTLTYTVKNEGSFLRPKYVAQIKAESWNNDWKHITKSELGISWSTEKAAITDQMKAALKGDPTKVFTYSYIDEYDGIDYGLPVRCQKIQPITTE